MSTTIPGTNITVDHYKDRTWREEFFTEHGTDYTARIWRERIGYADAEETEVVYQERADIPAKAEGADIVGGKPRCVTVRMAELAKWASIPLSAGGPNLDEIGALIVQANEAVVDHATQRRVLQYKLDNEMIDQEAFEDGLAALIETADG